MRRGSPRRRFELGAGLVEAEEGVWAVSAGVASGSAADFSLGDLATSVVLGAIGIERDLGPFEDCGATIRMRIRIAARSDAPNWGDCCLSYFAPALAKVSPNSWQPNARPVRRSQGARSAPRSGLGPDAEHGSGTPRATIGMRPFPAEEPGAKLVEAWQRPALLRECWFPLMRPCDLREFLRVPQGPKQQCVRLFASPCF